jgi:hypothetical protein
VSYELLYRPEADEALARLEADPAMAKILDAADDALDRLEDDPFDRRLGTHIFQTAEGRSVSATPVRFDEWYVFWRRGPRPGTLEITAVARIDV